MKSVGWGFVLIKIEEAAKRLKTMTIGAKQEPTWDARYKQHLIHMVGMHYEGVERAMHNGDYTSALTIGTDLLACLIMLSFYYD